MRKGEKNKAIMGILSLDHLIFHFHYHLKYEKLNKLTIENPFKIGFFLFL